MPGSSLQRSQLPCRCPRLPQHVELVAYASPVLHQIVLAKSKVEAEVGQQQQLPSLASRGLMCSRYSAPQRGGKGARERHTSAAARASQTYPCPQLPFCVLALQRCVF